MYDVNPMGGGRIIRDKLWFYMTYREIGSDNTVPGMWCQQERRQPECLDGGFRPEPAGVQRQPERHGHRAPDVAGDAAQQVQRPLVRAVQQREHERAAARATQTPEATGRTLYQPSRSQQATWSSPVPSRLLLEAGWGMYQARYRIADAADRRHPQPADDPVHGTGRRDPGPDLPDAGRHWRRLLPAI